MFNVAVLRLKDIIKYFVGFIIVVIAIIFLTKYFSSFKENTNDNIKQIEKKVESYSFLNCMNQTMPVISSINDNENEKQEEEKNKNNIYKQILQTGLSPIKEIENIDEEISEKEENIETNEQIKNNDQQENEGTQIPAQEEVKTGLPTEIVTNNPIKESFNVQYGAVKIKNQTEYNLTNEILEPNITIENKNIILFHTHSCESYTSSELYPYTPTGNFRTTDLNFTVTRVGTELENALKQYNYNVVHSKDYHDYPAYNGSYTRSLATVENILKTTKADIIMDVHRDAIGSRSDYAPCVKIGESDIAAQIMFVIGTNNGGLWHPNWQQNLKFAIKIQQKAEEMYPRIV